MGLKSSILSSKSSCTTFFFFLPTLMTTLCATLKGTLSVPQQSETFPQFKPEEIAAIMNDFSKPSGQEVATNARDQGRTPVSFGPTDLVCWRTLQGHIGKVGKNNAELAISLVNYEEGLL